MTARLGVGYGEDVVLRGTFASRYQTQDQTRHMQPSGKIAQAGESVALAVSDERYPAWLRAIPDPPSVLYCDGLPIPSDRQAIAIVGARHASPYGLRVTEALARDLTGLGFTIVSGLARGIDAAAHRGALTAGGRTIAVLGCGLDITYPPEHERLRAEIVGSGAVITEFSPGTPPSGSHFPRRNRIISGLSLGVVVVEAAEGSGSLITARLALEQGREVFAVPGPIDAPLSRGPHGLLKQGAKLVESVEDIVEELLPQLEMPLGSARGFYSPSNNKSRSVVPAASVAASSGNPLPHMQRVMSSVSMDLSPDEQIVYALISETPVHIDELMEQSRLVPAAFVGALLALELKAAVRRMPGQQYCLAR